MVNEERKGERRRAEEMKGKIKARRRVKRGGGGAAKRRKRKTGQET